MHALFEISGLVPCYVIAITGFQEGIACIAKIGHFKVAIKPTADLF